MIAEDRNLGEMVATAPTLGQQTSMEKHQILLGTLIDFEGGFQHNCDPKRGGGR
jgi:hypothetical protein